MVQVGEFALRIALGVAVIGLLFSCAGLITRRRRHAESARRLFYLNLALNVLAFIGLAVAFLTDQFQFEYVYQNSSTSMDTVYKFSAIWGGMEGSLLLWSFVLSMYAAIFAYTKSDEWRWSFLSGSFLALYLVQIFFLVLLNEPSFPFELVPPDARISDGSGLNPLLQNPGMATHPPMLYLGFVGLTIPFALAIGALFSDHLDDEWLDEARLWAMVAWIILGLGIMRGGLWAYQELGWGGYWAWDPVENASFMPWLLATAFIHSIMIQKHRGMLKVWNVSLVILAFAFTLLGTFLTRSGLITSVHTFARNQALGTLFLAFLGLVLFGGLVLIVWRWNSLQSQHTLDSFLSREFMFVLNNLVLVGITFAVFWGTMFPTFSELFTGERQSVGPPYYNMVTVPLFLLLILTTGVGSLIGWRKASWQNLKRNFTIPFLGFVLTLPVFWYISYTHATSLQAIASPSRRMLSFTYSALAYSLCVFTALTMIQEMVRGTVSRWRRFDENPGVAFLSLFQKNRQRYGGYIAHLGFLVVVVGIVTSSGFGKERVATVDPGQEISFAGYNLRFEGLKSFNIPRDRNQPVQARVLQANILVNFAGRDHDDARSGWPLLPQKRIYRNSQQPMTEVARDIRLSGDLYIVLSGIPQNQNGQVVLKLWYNPLVILVWTGVIIVAIGGFLALVPIPGITTSWEKGGRT